MRTIRIAKSVGVVSLKSPIPWYMGHLGETYKMLTSSKTEYLVLADSQVQRVPVMCAEVLNH